MANAHRVEAGITRRQREIALGRHAIVHKFAQPVVAESERRQCGRDLAALLPRKRTPEWMVGREVERRCLDGAGHDAVDQVSQGPAPAADLIWVVA